MTPLTNFSSMYDGDISKSIHQLTAEASKLKSEIFKAVVMAKDIDKKVPQFYMAYVNDFLRYWNEYADDLAEKMKKTKGTSGVRTIEYNFVKDYIYAKYDYASILQFTDGVVKGLTSGKFDDPDDIEDFKDHVLSKAFKDRAESVAGLLDDVLRSGNGPDFNVKVSPADVSQFNSCKSYNMFDRRDRKELYQAIEKTVDFMCFDINKNRYPNTKDIKLFVSFVNNVVEYMSYSLTAYATRIYIIQAYAYPFIFGAESFNESVESELPEDKGSTSSVEITTMHDADEYICRDPANVKKYEEILNGFLKVAGSDSMFDEVNKRFQYIGQKELESNLFCAKLMANPLHELLRGHALDGIYGSNMPTSIRELKHKMHEYVYNPKQGLQGITTPKQQLMHVIRGTAPDTKTLRNYQELARDLYICSMNMLFHLSNLTFQLLDWVKREKSDPMYNNSAIFDATELAKLCGDLYREIAVAVLFKARDIEMTINDINEVHKDKVIAGLTIKIPGEKKSDLSSSDNMMSAVPDTTRMPIDLMDLYSLPAFESMEMYDEFVKNLPGMEDDPYYFGEAVSINDLINTIISKLKGIRTRWDNFFNDKYFQRAVKWVKEHQNALSQMTYNGEMQVLPYRKNTYISQIDKMISNMQNGFTAETLKSEENMTKFIHSLYDGGNKKLIDLFETSKTEPKNAALLYQNYVLFGIDPATTSSVQVNVKKLNGHKEIYEELMNVWFDNVSKANETYQGLIGKSKEIDAAFNSLKAKIVQIQNETKRENGGSGVQNPADTVPPPVTAGKSDSNPGAGAAGPGAAPAQQNQQQPTNTGSNTTGSQTPATNSQPKDGTEMNDSTSAMNTILVRVQTVIDQLWGNLYGPITRSIKDQYKYIQEAHSLGRKV